MSSFAHEKSNPSFENTEFVRRIENAHLRIQLEHILTLIPDFFVKISNSLSDVSEDLILLFLEVSGVTRLCRNHHKFSDGGTPHLTLALNSFSACVIEIIYFYGGDLLKSNGKEFLVVWPVHADANLSLRNAISSALHIKNTMAGFRTETGFELKIKSAIGYGPVAFCMVGNTIKDCGLHGSAVDDVKFGTSLSLWGDVVVSSKASKLLDWHDYHFSSVTYGFVKVYQCLNATGNCFENSTVSLDELCRKHLDYKRTLILQHRLNQSPQEIEMLEYQSDSSNFRQAVRSELKDHMVEDLKPFINKLLQDRLDDNPSATLVNEFRYVAVVYVDITTGQCTERQFRILLDDVYAIIQNFVAKYHGLFIWLSTHRRDLVAELVFGLRSSKGESCCKNALLCSYGVFQQGSKVFGVKKLSIGVSYGSAYNGLIGHTHRKNYVVLGSVANKAVSLTRSFPNKLTCDYPVYKKSKLSSKYFKILSSSNGSTFEYNHSYSVSTTEPKLDLVGRDDEYELVYGIVNHPDRYDYYGICFYGPRMMGKSVLIRRCYNDMSKDGYTVVSVDLCQCTQRPYYCLSNLYKQLYNEKSSVETDDFPFIKQLPSELFDVSEILQSDDNNSNGQLITRKFRILSLFREMVRRNSSRYTVIFIDNIQFIDTHSLDILETIISERCVRLICAGEFEKSYWDVRWRLSLNNYIKLLEISPLSRQSVTKFVCGFLQITGVHKRLISILRDYCGGSPGITEKFVYELSSKGYIEIIRISINPDTVDYYICLNKPPTYPILVARLKEEYEMTDQITDYVISMNIVSQLRPLELSTLTTCVMLGEMFSKSSLMALSDTPSEYTMLCVIKQLFYLEIIECGYQCLTPMGFAREKGKCYCPDDPKPKDKMLWKLPKFAFCKLFHFRDATIKQIVYSLMKEEDKMKMHKNVIDHIENRVNMCFSCAKNNCLPIVKVENFFNIFDTSYSSIEPVANIGDYIYSEIVENLEFKVLDISVCSCLEISLQTYGDLIEHCIRLNYIDKQIFYMIQTAIIAMSIREYEHSITILFKVLHICTKNVLNNFRKSTIGRVNLLIVKAFLSIDNTFLAKKYLLLALERFISYFPKGKINLDLIKSNGCNINDFAECLNLVTKYYVAVQDWNSAKISCDESFYLIQSLRLREIIVFELSTTMIPLYCYTAERSKLKALMNRVRNETSVSTAYSMQELFAIANLFKVIFFARLLNGKLYSTVRLGYRILSFTQSINAHVIQLDVLITLSWALMKLKRIQDSVEIARSLRQSEYNTNDLAMLGYYIISLELIIETSFTLEPIKNIYTFAVNYFNVRKRKNYTTIEKTFLIYLYNHHLRNNRWRDVCVWKNYLTFADHHPTDLQSSKNLFKYTECILITLVKNEMFETRATDVKCAENYLEMCKLVAEKFRSFSARYYHLRSYFERIIEKKSKSRKNLNNAIKIATQNGDVLEYCWLLQSGNSWDGGFSFEGDKKYVDWRCARTYAPIHWSQILYALPLHL